MNNGYLLNHVTHGEGRPVILIHGMAASRWDWEYLAPDLNAAGYRTYAVDLLGHGDSHKPHLPQHYTIQAVYAALEDWIDSLKIDPPYILVGHSMGGYLSLKYGLRHPERTAALTLIDPLYSVRQLSPIFRVLHRRPGLGIRMLEHVPENVLDALIGLDPTTGKHISHQARHQIAIDIKRASPQILNLPRTVPDLTPDLGHMRAPAQVIWGKKDLTLNPGSFPALVQALPWARGYAVSGCGHQPHLSRPEVTNRAILKFLNAAGK